MQLLGPVRLRLPYTKRAQQPLKREPQAELDLAIGRGRFSDRAELRRVHESVRRTKVGAVQRVEELVANADLRRLREPERVVERRVECLQAGTINSVAPHVAERERRRRREGLRVKPSVGCARAGAEYRSAGVVSAHWVLSED